MSQEAIQDIIFERVFRLDDSRGSTEDFKLQFGRPYQVSLEWRCPFQINGLGEMRVHTAPGVDALDALFNGLRLAEKLIHSSKRPLERVMWRDSSDLGLSPLPLSQQPDEQQSPPDSLENIFKEIFDKFFGDRNSK